MAPPVGYKKHRHMMERVRVIHEHLVSSRRGVNASSLSVELEVSKKTIHRDLEFMRDQLGAPLAYDGAEHSYAYAEPYALPFLPVNGADVLALARAVRIIGRPNWIAKQLDEMYERLEKLMPASVRFEGRRIRSGAAL